MNFKKALSFFSFFALIIFNIFATDLLVINQNSRTIDKITINNENQIIRQSNIIQTGLYANQLYQYGNNIYCVNSGDNQIQVFNKNNFQNISTINVGAGNNPWHMIIHNQKIWVTNFFTNCVKVFSLQGNELQTINVGIGPEGIIYADNYIWVTNTGGYPDYNNATISKIDPNNYNVVATIQVGKNPQEIAYLNGKLHVVCTGKYDYSGKIYIINPQNNQIENILNIGGNPTNIAYSVGNSTKAYLGEGFGMGLYCYNYVTNEILHSPNNIFGKGGSGIAIDNLNRIYSVDAKDWVNNSWLYIYNFNESLIDSVELGVGGSYILILDQINDISENDIFDNFEAKVYPNPANPLVNISFETKINDDYKFYLYNIKGELVKTINGRATNNTTTLTINTNDNNQNLASGIYLYKIVTSSNKKFTGKFSIIK